MQGLPDHLSTHPSWPRKPLVYSLLQVVYYQVSRRLTQGQLECREAVREYYCSVLLRSTSLLIID
jgi:hypothetical protein